MKTIKRILCSAFAVGICLLMTACGSSVAENTSAYFKAAGRVIDQLMTTGNKLPPKEEDNPFAAAGENKTKLAAPENFVVDKDGNYSFDAVEGASYYLIYFCEPEATSDTDSFLYSSTQIKEDGSATYSGNTSDLFEYAYGDYLVKAYAFPDLLDEEHTSSTASMATYLTNGTQSAPEVFYYWDAYSSIMRVQVGNMDEYKFQAYPSKVDITFTNVEDSADTVTITIDEITEDSYGAESEALAKGETYRVTAVSFSDSEFVSNSVSDESVIAEKMTIGESNLYTYGYDWDDGFDRNLFNWPFVGENFDPINGGIIGTSTDYSVAAYAPGRRDVEFIATPKAAAEGALYSYDVTANVVYSALNNAVVGAIGSQKYEVHLYADGTLKGSAGGSGGIVPSTIEGTWVENEDGTLTVSYNHSSIVKS